jgi:CHRD domain/PEP-CTERM motif
VEEDEVKKLMSAGIALGAMLVFGIPARADFLSTTVLTGGQETPPNMSTAAGGGSVMYNTGANDLSFLLSFDGIASGATMAHIHFGLPGVAGPVIFSLIDYANGSQPTHDVITGTLSAADFIPDAADGLNTFQDAVNAIAVGEAYMNVHSNADPAGEIRGQLSAMIAAVPEPASMGLLGVALSVGAAAGLRRRRPRAWQAN